MDEIPTYQIRRSGRRSFTLSLDNAGNVCVRAPLWASEQEIAHFVARHARWIARRRAVLAAFRLDLADGARLTLYGVAYTIATGRARLGEGVVYLPKEGREGALAALLKRVARAYMSALVASYAAAHAFSYTKVCITSARGRWGSCGANGHLSFSFRTAFLSPLQAEYIVVHELCHTRHLDHSAAFWAEVGRILPAYAAIRKSLRAVAGVMNWL